MDTKLTVETISLLASGGFFALAFPAPWTPGGHFLIGAGFVFLVIFLLY